MAMITTSNKDEVWFQEDCWNIIKEFMIKTAECDWSSKTFQAKRFIRVYPTPFWKEITNDKTELHYLNMNFVVEKTTPKMVYIRQLQNANRNGVCCWKKPIDELLKAKRYKIKKTEDGKDYCELKCMYSGDKITLFPFETKYGSRFMSVFYYMKDVDCL